MSDSGERRYEDIDYGDVAELDEAFFRKADLQLPRKQPVTLRIDGLA